MRFKCFTYLYCLFILVAATDMHLPVSHKMNFLPQQEESKPNVNSNETKVKKQDVLKRSLPIVKSLKSASSKSRRHLLEESFHNLPLAHIKEAIQLSELLNRRVFLNDQIECEIDNIDNCFVKGLQVSLKHSLGISWCVDCLDSHETGSFIEAWEPAHGLRDFHLDGLLAISVPNNARYLLHLIYNLGTF